MTEAAEGDPAPTARGDVDGRRRDVLAAAASLLDERSGTGFSMREVAERAGVSAGAVYQWFSGKAEILAVLHAERFESELRRVRDLPDDTTFHGLVADVLGSMAVHWAEIGHHRNTIVDDRSGAEQETFVEHLVDSFRALSAEVDRRFRRAAEREGLRLRPAAEAMPWFWAVCVGTGTQLIDLRFLGSIRPEDYLAGLVDPTAGGLVDSHGE